MADHLIPLRRGGRRVDGNLQGVCLSCGNRKTAMSDGGFGNPVKRGGGAA
jgi:5-methylcytosine-specific restriction endonuclease McrA